MNAEATLKESIVSNLNIKNVNDFTKANMVIRIRVPNADKCSEIVWW